MPLWFAIGWGCLAIVIGGCLVVFRRWASNRIKARQERMGMPSGLFTQSPIWLACGGALFVVLGLGMIIGVSTGIIHTT